MRLSKCCGKLLSALVVSTALQGLGAADCSPEDLLHRWSFNGNYNDPIGGITATTFGAVSFNNASSPTAARVAGTAKDTAYIKLGAGIVPAETSPLTIEVWATQHSVKNWARIFDFGSNADNNLLMAWTMGTDANTECVEIKSGATSILRVENSLRPYTLNVPYHIAMTITPNADGTASLAWAKRDTSTGAILNSGSATTTAAWNPAVIAGWEWNGLGRSQYGDSDADASYDEVRIWKKVLTAAQLTTSAQLGPDVLPVLADSGVTRTINLTSENGTVSVNGAAGVGTGAVTVPWSTGLRLVATPAAGSTFCRWEGDTKYIVSGSVTSPEIILATAQNIFLTAVFDTAVAVYARYANGGFNYLSAGKGSVAAPEGGMNNNITILFSSDAEYQGLKTVAEDVAKAKGLELEANITLDTDVDWRDLNFSLAGHTLDIAGAQLTLANIPGAGTITSSQMLKNGDFQADACASGASLAMIPMNWNGTGTINVWNNNHDLGDAECNGSTWVYIANGGSISQLFTVPTAGEYTLSFTFSAWNNKTSYQTSTYYAQIDGADQVRTSTSGWNATSFSKAITLNAGTHTVKIGCSGGKAVNFDNVTLTRIGVVNFNIPAGITAANPNTADGTVFGGGANLQVWKTGAGTLNMEKGNTGFGANGATSLVVKEGAVKKGSGATVGAQYSRIRVENGGQFDLNGRSYHDYHYALAGEGPDGLGALVSRTYDGSPHYTNGTGYMYNLTLDDDTKIGGTTPMSLAFWNSSPNTTALNGHTLTLGNTTIYSGTMSFTGTGTVYVAPGATYKFNDFWNGTATINQGTLRVGGNLEIQGNMIASASNLVFTSTGKFVASTVIATTVYDRYAPNLAWSGSQRHPTVTLGTATSLFTCLDLALFTDTFDASTTTFYAGSSVKVELGARTLVDNQKLVAWSAIPNVAEFVGSGENLGDFRLLARADGLYAVAAPAWAVWDLVNECWQYFRSTGEPYGAEWTEGITDKIDVHFSSIAEFNTIKAMGVTPAKFVLTKLELPKGTALYDFTGSFDFTIPPNTVIDLKGNKLKLPPALIGGAVPFTVTDSTFVTAEPATSPAVLKNACFWLDALDTSTMAIDGAGRVTQWTSKDANHVVATATTTAAPTYKATGYAIPTVDFGAIGSNLDMVYNRFSNLRTVFWVMQIAKGEGAFFLGDSANYNFHRGAAGQYGNASYHKYASMWNGLSGVDIANAYPPDNQFCVYSATMNVNAISDRLTTDRNCTSGGILRTGGRQLSELICFNTVLSDADRRAVVLYLQDKWFRGGELIVEVPEGQTIANNNVAITGGTRLVKAGAGTLNANKTGQGYSGGTLVSAGKVVLGNNTCIGANGNEITVEPDGVLEMNGKGDIYNYRFVLAGGTLQNTTADLGSGTAQIANLSLMADSTFKATCSSGLIGSGYAATTLDLAEHTLAVSVADGKSFWLYNATVTEGTIDIAGGTLAVDKTAVNAPNTTFRVNSIMNITVPITVGGYVGLYSVDNNLGTGVMTVNKVFKPCTPYYRGATLANGAILDLSGFSGVFTGLSAFGGGGNVVTYPAGTEADGNAKLFVELHGRALTNSKIIGWEPATPPAFLDFEVTERTKKDGRSLEVRGDGVYVLGGTVLFFR